MPARTVPQGCIPCTGTPMPNARGSLGGRVAVAQVGVPLFPEDEAKIFSPSVPVSGEDSLPSVAPHTAPELSQLHLCALDVCKSSVETILCCHSYLRYVHMSVEVTNV